MSPVDELKDDTVEEVEDTAAAVVATEADTEAVVEDTEESARRKIWLISVVD
jgi:hypothetical protein